MHCTGQTSTHARSFTSIHASVMIARPDICYASSAHGRRRCVNARHRPISPTTAVTGVVAHDLSVRGRVPGGHTHSRPEALTLKLGDARRLDPGQPSPPYSSVFSASPLATTRPCAARYAG